MQFWRHTSYFSCFFVFFWRLGSAINFRRRLGALQRASVLARKQGSAAKIRKRMFRDDFWFHFWSNLEALEHIFVDFWSQGPFFEHKKRSRKKGPKKGATRAGSGLPGGLRRAAGGAGGGRNMRNLERTLTTLIQHTSSPASRGRRILSASRIPPGRVRGLKA